MRRIDSLLVYVLERLSEERFRCALVYAEQNGITFEHLIVSRARALSGERIATWLSPKEPTHGIQSEQRL